MVSMFDSLKEWMTCPATIIPFEGVNAAADKIYGEPVEIKCYFTGQATIVNDAQQNQVFSATQIYYDPAKYTINPQDKVLVDGMARDIIAITNYMDGNNGTSSIKIVYL